jgi:predicted lipoprotein with Yx(FWY)xxD motif
MPGHSPERRVLFRGTGTPGRSRPDLGLLALRVSGALLLVASGIEHLVLSLADGYGRIPTIGPLFVLQAATAFALALAVSATPRPVVSLGGALFALATLGGYLLSVNVGLFGFREVVTVPGIASGLINIAAFSVLGFAGTAPQAWAGCRRSFCALPPGMLVVPISLAALATFAVGLSQASPGAGVSAAGENALIVVQLPRYGGVLATAHGDTLYLLRGAGGAQVSCEGSCVSLWPPLVVGPSVRAVRAGPGVRGTLGLAPRDGGRQVTYNGYRLYTYAGDTGPRQSNGEGVVSFGGTWDLVRASATQAATTAVTHAS